MYVRSDIDFKVRQDLDNDNLEAVWIDILLPKSRPILFGVVYRPPHQSDFIQTLELVCAGCHDFLNREVILMADNNIDVLNTNGPLYNGFCDFLKMHGLTQLISVPTRITEHSQTAIDHIMVSDTCKIMQSGVIVYGISDHFLTYCTRKVKRAPINCHRSLKIRSLKRYDPINFLDMLNKINWMEITNICDVDLAWGQFQTTFLDVLDKIAPQKEIRIKQRSQPWINNDILDKIHLRDKILSEFKKAKLPALFKEYRALRNKVQRMVDEAKKDYFRSKIEEHKKDSKKLWETLRPLGAKENPKHKQSKIGLDINGSISHDKKMVANTFNSFFTTIASNLVKKLPSTPGVFSDPLKVQKFYEEKGVQPNTFYFKQVTEELVFKKLKGLNSSKATGFDSIPAKFLKDAAEIITPVITYLINLSITNNHFPHKLKVARVIPLYKKGLKSDPGNFRPISILCTISKIVERIIYEQIDSYLAEQNILFDFQSGFRKAHSTDTCLLYLTDFIRKEVDKGNVCGMVLIDLQKAFDTVQYDILLNKLKALGFSDSSLQWVRSYLVGREQVVDVEGTLSSPLKLTCGVPQGSILGPLFFLLYVNDMPSAIDCHLFLFADDSAILVSHKDKSEVERLLSVQLSKLSVWLADNKLSLHLGKTESILFGSRDKLRKSQEFRVTLGNFIITAREVVTYLGCILDNKLTGEFMAQRVITKVSQRTKFLARISSLLDRNTLKTLADALVQCHFDYACTSWYTGTSKGLKVKLQTCQNKLIRVVHKLHPRTHLHPDHFSSLRWLKVEERVSQLKLCLVYKIKNNLAPKYLVNYFSKVSDTHNYSTRGSSTDYRLCRFKSCMGKFSFLYSAAVLWNGLPLNLKTVSSSYSNFKFLIKKIVSQPMN